MTQKHKVRKNIGKGTHKEFVLGYAKAMDIKQKLK